MAPLRDKFLGCILGHAVGDAVGAPVEGLPATAIWYDLGGARRLVMNPPVEQLCYTDDTQMTIAVAESLLRDGRIIEKTLCDAFVDNYDPNRGYGRGARKVINAMASGGDGWREVAANVFPGGSLGNGAAMRAAPLGLLFHDDLDRVWHEAALSALPTHVHPVGVEGAQLVALAVALCVRSNVFNRTAFYRELIARATRAEFLDPSTELPSCRLTNPSGSSAVRSKRTAPSSPQSRRSLNPRIRTRTWSQRPSPSATTRIPSP